MTAALDINQLVDNLFFPPATGLDPVELVEEVLGQDYRHYQRDLLKFFREVLGVEP